MRPNRFSLRQPGSSRSRQDVINNIPLINSSIMGLVIIIIIIIMELLMLVVLNKGPGNRDTLNAGFGRFPPLVGGDDH